MIAEPRKSPINNNPTNEIVYNLFILCGENVLQKTQTAHIWTLLLGKKEEVEIMYIFTHEWVGGSSAAFVSTALTVNSCFCLCGRLRC